MARNHRLRRILAAAFISGCGDRLHQVALAAVILTMTNSLVAAGLVFAVSMLPYVLFGLPVGALVDRWDRRSAMVVSDLVRAALVLALPIVAFISVPLVYPLLFGLTCATMVFHPARQAAIPDLVDADDLSQTNILFQVVSYTVDLAVLPMAGILVTLATQRLGLQTGALTIFGLDALSYLASAALLLRLPLASAAKQQAELSVREVWSRAADGLRFLKADKPLLTNTVLLTVAPLLLGSLHTLWIGYAWRISHTDTFGYATIETATAAGTLAGLWLLPRLLRLMSIGRAILSGFAVMGSAVALAGVTHELTVAASLAALSGVGNMLFIVPSITFVQKRTPTDVRGRVFSVRLALTFGAFAASNAIAGILADIVTVSSLLVVVGAALVLTAAVGSLFPSARRI
ncbi:MAG: MFS transporter [Chloroflexota bacterium]